MVTSFARMLNQHDYLDDVHCAALWAKSPGISGASTNLPVTLFQWSSEQRQRTVSSICSESTDCVSSVQPLNVFKRILFRGGFYPQSLMWKPLGRFGFMKWIFQLTPERVVSKSEANAAVGRHSFNCLMLWKHWSTGVNRVPNFLFLNYSLQWHLILSLISSLLKETLSHEFIIKSLWQTTPL